MIRPISRDWSFRVASTGAAARWYPSKSGTGREWVSWLCGARSESAWSRNGRKIVFGRWRGRSYTRCHSFLPASLFLYLRSSFCPFCRETTFSSPSHSRPVVRKKKEKTDKRCAWIRRPSKIDSSRKLGANGVARAWACQWRRCVDRFSRASRACMNSRGGKSIGLRPVRPYRRMCRIVRRTTEGDSIWSSSSFDERDRISKQFAEENEERIEEGRIVRALSIAERVVTFRGGARRRGKGRSNYKTFDREQETDQGRNNRRGYESK